MAVIEVAVHLRRISAVSAPGIRANIAYDQAKPAFSSTSVIREAARLLTMAVEPGEWPLCRAQPPAEGAKGAHKFKTLLWWLARSHGCGSAANGQHEVT